MGSTGASGFKEAFIGSTAEKVIRYADVPVMVLQKSQKLSTVKRILFPTTMALHQPQLIRQIKQLQQLYEGAVVHVLLISTPYNFIPQDEAEARIEKFLKHYKLEGYKVHFCSYLSEESGIMHFAKSRNMDMIVMGTHGRKGLAHLLSRSITENVVNRIDTALIALRLK
jgi:nucleotide-binding universal stress UspA family protein